MSVLHANMRLNRKQLRLTQQDIADMLNVDRSTYTAYETKRVPSLDILIKLSKLYCLTLDELVGIVHPGEHIYFEEESNPFKRDDELDIFDKYLNPAERKLLFSIRMLTDEQVREVIGLIKKYSEENSIPEN